MTERFIVDTAGTLVDMVTRDTFDYVSDVVGLLNKFNEENEKLKKDRFICLDCEHSGYTEIGCLCEYNDHWQECINKCENFKEWQRND